MNINSIWCEKYRPTKIEDLIISDENRKVLEHFKAEKDIPHLLFVSTPGTGKTSTAKLIVKDILKCDYLYINASDENGIDTIRHKIIGFAKTKSFDGGIKVVILDEADSLSGDGARALRNVMEEYSNNTRFILTANYRHKIITPIQSRCQTLNFEHNFNDIIKYCTKILLKENVSISKDQIEPFKKLVRSNFPDIRKILNDLQRYSLSGVLDIKNSLIDNEFVSDILDKITNINVCDIRKYIISNETTFQSDYHNLMKHILNYMCDINMDNLKRQECLLILGHHMDRHSHVIDIEINFFVCIVALSKILNQSNN
jgi:replication factor C small subunit